MNLVPSSFEDPSPEWARALSNVLAFALSARLRALTLGADSSELTTERRIRELISGSLKEAILGFERHALAHCPHIRCREEAIVVAVAAKEAKLMGVDVEAVEMRSLVGLYEWLDGRN